MIWPEVTKVGIASARSETGRVYVVARYEHCQIRDEFPYDASMAYTLYDRHWSEGQCKLIKILKLLKIKLFHRA